MENWYEILQIKPDSSQAEIKKAYFALIRLHPPEKDPENFQKIRQAYEFLSDENKRNEYD